MKPEVVRAFYQHLKARDISRHGQTFEGTRPITAYYNEVSAFNIPIVARYLSTLVNREFSGFLTSSKLYSECDAMANRLGFKFKGTYNITKFINELKQYDDGVGLDYKKNPSRGFQIHACMLRRALEKAKVYDQDISWSLDDEVL